jgi:hypothetical protein
MQETGVRRQDAGMSRDVETGGGRFGRHILSAYCFLLPASCVLPTASCLLSSVSCLLPPLTKSEV